MASAQVKDAKCHCGRPLGHTGRHIGFKPAPKDGHPKKHKVIMLVESELAAKHADISRLKREIKAKQDELLDAEFKLRPLLALQEAYEHKRIEGPAVTAPEVTPPSPASKTNVQPFSMLKPKVASSDADATEEDFEPIEADFVTVQKWAAVRNLRFQTWADLQSINMRREQFELPPFKKKL